MILENRSVLAAAAVLALAMVAPGRSQQPIVPVDFRPFMDGRNWIVRQPLVYTIGVSNDTVTVPPGFVTDLASIPRALQSIIQQNGRYLLPAVVHDYLYWKQTCTRKQSDQILLLAMIENEVSDVHRFAIYNAVRAAGSFAWDTNAEEREAELIRIIPENRLTIPRIHCGQNIENSWKPRESRMDLTMSSLTPFVSGLTCQWMTR